MKNIKTSSYKESQASASQGVNASDISAFSTRLKQLTDWFATDITVYNDNQQALSVLDKIQTVVQKIVASLQSGSKVNTVNTQRAIDQVRGLLADPSARGHL